MLPVETVGTPVAVPHAALGLAKRSPQRGGRGHAHPARRPSRSRHVPKTPSPSLGSPTRPAVPPVRTGDRCMPRLLLGPHPRGSSPHGEARARWTPRSIAVPRRAVPLMGGPTWGICRPTGIRAADPGGSCTAEPVVPLGSQRMAPHGMASASRPSSWGGRWARWRRAWASAPSPGGSRSTRTPGCNGWSQERTTPQPCPNIACTTCASRRSNGRHSLRGSAPSRRGRSATRRPSNVCRGHPVGWGGAIDPVTKWRRTIDVGERTLAMAQRVVHQVPQVLAPGWVP